MSNDVKFQVECLTTELTILLMKEYGWDMHRSLDELYTSQTYSKLCDPACGLYYEGAVYIFSFLKNEIERGVMQ